MLKGPRSRGVPHPAFFFFIGSSGGGGSNSSGGGGGRSFGGLGGVSNGAGGGGGIIPLISSGAYAILASPLLKPPISPK